MKIVMFCEVHPRLWSWTIVYLLSFPKSHLSDFHIHITLIFEKNLKSFKHQTIAGREKKLEFQRALAKHGGLMASALVSRLSGLG